MALSRPPPLLAVAPIVTLPWTSLPAELRDLTAFASPLNISFPTPAARVSSSYLLLLSLLLCSFSPSWLPLPRRAQPTSPVLPPPPRTRLPLDIHLCPRSRCMFCGKHEERPIEGTMERMSFDFLSRLSAAASGGAAMAGEGDGSSPRI